MTELGFLARAFARQPRLGVGGRLMGIVAALLAMKVNRGIAGVIRRLLTTIPVLALEAFVAGPGLDQRAVDREVLARQQRAHLWQVQHRGHELARNIAVEQPVPILAEHSRIPHWIVGR